MSEVTDAAVEAGARAAFPQGWYDLPETPAKARSRQSALDLTRTVLEAAHPHMITRRRCRRNCSCICHDTGGSNGAHPRGHCPGKDAA